MGKVLIVVGFGIAYLCWVTKRGAEYWDKKSLGVIQRRSEIQRKIEESEKLTRMEFLDFYVTRIVYGSLKYGMYGGLALSLVGVALYIFN